MMDNEAILGACAQHALISARQLGIASNNRGKIAELQQYFNALDIEVIAQQKWGIPPAIESGRSFVENALIKARHLAVTSQCPTLADDSGLIVDSLNGHPGIRSARFAGEGASDEDNNKHLLAAMAQFTGDKRRARFHCAIVLLTHEYDPTPLIAQADWQGSILHSPQGENGFGYDSVFWVPTHKKSAAQLDSAEKNHLSHRGQAMQMLLRQLGI